eukprot:1402361-Pyramimonas_sp.AAC.1
MWNSKMWNRTLYTDACSGPALESALEIGSWCSRDPGVCMFRCLPRTSGKTYTPHHASVVLDPRDSPGTEKQPATGNVYVPAFDKSTPCEMLQKSWVKKFRVSEFE